MTCQKGAYSIALGHGWPKVFDLTWGMQSICGSAEEQSCLEGVYTVRRSKDRQETSQRRS